MIEKRGREKRTGSKWSFECCGRRLEGREERGDVSSSPSLPLLPAPSSYPPTSLETLLTVLPSQVIHPPLPIPRQRSVLIAVRIKVPVRGSRRRVRSGLLTNGRRCCYSTGMMRNGSSRLRLLLLSDWSWRGLSNRSRSRGGDSSRLGGGREERVGSRREGGRSSLGGRGGSVEGGVGTVGGVVVESWGGGSGVTWVLDGSGDVGREVDDDLSVNDEVVVGLLELLREHLWMSFRYRQPQEKVSSSCEAARKEESERGRAVSSERLVRESSFLSLASKRDWLRWEGEGNENAPCPPSSRSRTSLTLTLMTPRKP